MLSLRHWLPIKFGIYSFSGKKKVETFYSPCDDLNLRPTFLKYEALLIFNAGPHYSLFINDASFINLLQQLIKNGCSLKGRALNLRLQLSSL